MRYDPDDEILVTAGATEAIAAAMLALVEPGDEVIAFEPYYDSYAANIAMAGGVRVPVTLRPPGFRPDLNELKKAITAEDQAHPAEQPAQPDRHGLRPPRTGRDRGPGRRARPARGHRRGLRAPGLRPRARPDRPVSRDARADRVGQLGGQDVLLHRLEDRLGQGRARAGDRGEDGQAVPHVRQRRPVPVRGGAGARAAGRVLRKAEGRPHRPARPAHRWPGRDRLPVYRPQGTYFVTADIRPLGYHDGVEFCRTLPDRVGVVAIPTAIFYDHPERAAATSGSPSASSPRC